MDWANLMRAGLHDLHLSPAEFWALTPAELQIKLGLDRRFKPMARDQFDALRAAYPDS